MALSGKIAAGADLTFTLANEGTVAMVDAVADITGPKFSGQLCFNRTGKDLYRWDGAQWVVVNATRLCTADSPAVNNSTVLVSSTFLTVPVGTNTNYLVDMGIIYTASAVADFKFQLTPPAGSATTIYAGWQSDVTAAAANAAIFHDSFAAAGSIAAGGIGVAAPLTARPWAFVATGGTAGNLVFQFSQNTAEATNAVLKAASWMRVTAA